MSIGSTWVERLSAIWSDIDSASNYPEQRPLLAHYTSIPVLEQILRNHEFWFSNPLFMNDWEELKFGINESADALASHEGLLSAFRSKEIHQSFLRYFHNCYSEFSNEHALDTYVLCFSEHATGDDDGRLSMWRGYGNNGGGTAIVIDLEKVGFVPNSPLIIAKVEYQTTDSRKAWIQAKLNQFAALLEEVQIPESELHFAARGLFERFKIFALFTKHKGFDEEKEWRAVYLRERDSSDLLTGMLHYHVGPRGVEPKLKFKVAPVEGLTPNNFSLDNIVHKIVLGPTASSPLSLASVRRMLHHCGHSVLASKIVTSTTPFRG